MPVSGSSIQSDYDTGDEVIPPPPAGATTAPPEGLPALPTGAQVGPALPPLPHGATTQKADTGPLQLTDQTPQADIDAARKAGRGVLVPGEAQPRKSIPLPSEKPEEAIKAHNWDLSGFEEPPQPPSATKSFVRGAAAGAVPAVGGLAGFGAGAALGAEAGALGGPAAWLTVPAGALVGGLAGAYGIGTLADMAQKKVLSYLPDSAKEAVGLGDKQQAEAQAEHPYMFEAGTMAPNLVAFSPLAAERAATEGASAIARLMSHPVTARAVPAAIMAAQEVVQKTAEGEPIDPGSLALAAGAGALMQRETAIGKRLIGAGAAPVESVFSHIRGGPEAINNAANGTPSATPPGAAPQPGEIIGMPMGNAGIQRMTVSQVTPEGDVILTDENGVQHPMTSQDVARLRMEAPDAAKEEATGAPPAAEAPPPEGASSPAQPEGAAAPTPAAPAEPEFPEAREPIEFNAPASFAPPAEAVANAEASAVDAAARQQVVSQPQQGEQAVEQRIEADRAEVAQPAPGPVSREGGQGPVTPTPPQEVISPEAQATPLAAEKAAAEPAAEPVGGAQRSPDVGGGQPEAVPVESAVAAPAPPERPAEPISEEQPTVPRGTEEAQATTPPAEPVKNAPVVTDEKHTKTGADIFYVRFPEKPDIADLGANARRFKGQWSSYRGGGARPGWTFKTRDAADRFAQWAREQLGDKTPEAEPTPTVAPLLEPGEHPGLRIRSLETGKETTIQPAGTRQPSRWTEIGRNSDGQAIHEDQNGVRSLVNDRGIRTTEPVEMRPTRNGVEAAPRTDAERDPEYQVAPEPTTGTKPPEEVTDNVEKAREQTETRPTDSQIESGEYPKGQVDFHGLPFQIETPAGEFREGPKDANGVPAWRTQMPDDVDYGEVRGTEGADRDPVDMFLGPDHASQQTYVVDQVDPDTGAFDEHKILAGFPSLARAREAYIDAFSDGRGPERLGNITPMSLDELKDWLKTGDTKNPIGQYDLGALPRSEDAPTSVAEARDGVQNPVPAGDEGPSPADVRGASEVEPVRPPPSGEEPGGAQPTETGLGERSSPEPSEGTAGGGNRSGDADRVLEGREGAEPGTAGGPAGPPRRIDLDKPRRIALPKAAGREVDIDADVMGKNFALTPEAIDEDRSPRAKARDNLAAIELAKQILAEDRPATKEEQAVLAKYVGWGGLSGAFQDSAGNFRKGFEDVGARLKQLLTKKEYDAAAESTQYAHYTSAPVINGMWRAMERLGFKGGSVFEPGMGIGHFIGLMPPDIAAASRYHGIEIDPLTASIAKLIYPQAGIRQADFIRTPLPKDSFDIAIGNPPFADITVRGDPLYKARGFLLHDYFFAKSLDSVRPGGLLGFVTSAGTMNKLDTAARRYLAQRAEFVGGVRLPSSAFAKSAGTEVTTDILFFKKRAALAQIGDEVPEWAQTVMKTLPNAEGAETAGNVNRYFADHPEQVLGREGFFDKLYKDRYAVHPEPGADLATQLDEAMARLPENVMDAPLTPEQKAEIDFSAEEKKDGSFYLKNGQVMQYLSGAGSPIRVRGKGVEGGFTQKQIQTIRDLVPIRDALRDVFRHDLAGNTEEAAAARAALNKTYDDFVAKNGPINKVEYQYRRPSRVQMENLRSEAREESRENGMLFDEGEFDPRPMIAAGRSTADIAAARDTARERAARLGRTFDEGSFDPADVPNLVIEKRENIDPFGDDPESYRLRAMEKYDDSTNTAAKRRIFFENPLDDRPEPDVKSPQDGVLWSMNRYGKLDLDQIAEKLGTTKTDVIEQLGDGVFRQPGTDGTYAISDDYLSGDVVSKLQEAEAAALKDPAFERNVTALRGVQPAPIAPADISIRLGMPWVPPDVFRSFMSDHLQLGRGRIRYEPMFGTWQVDTYNYGEGQEQWGTQRVKAAELLQDALNRTSPKVYDLVDKKRVLNPEATQAANDKLQGMKDEFQSYLNSTPEVLDRLADTYNNRYNRTVLRKWDGNYLTTPGVSKDWSWRPHQLRGIARIIQDGNTYIAHAVGAGKTSLAIGAAMEMKRLGLVRKPMFVVPVHMLGQFAKEWYEQYPTARLMVADEDKFHTSRRKQFVADVAQQDLDGVIITNSAFKKIPISADFEADLIQEEVAKLDEGMRSLGQDPEELGKVSRDARDNIITVKKMQAQKKRLVERLRGKTNSDVDQTNTFEELGVDHLTVDEAHQFRKLNFVTKLNLKGISSEGSDMAWDLYAKSRYLDRNNPGRSMVMMSGTPITNTMGELYSLSRYMQPAALKEHGVDNFDAWAQTFGETKTELEQNAQGTYDQVERFASLTNVPELYKMVGSIMDVVTPTQLSENVIRPDIKGGQREFHLAPRTPFLDKAQQALGQRVEAIKARKGPPTKGDDILLSVINDGRLIAMDPRFVDPSQPANTDSKLNQMIANVHDMWRRGTDTQFYDPATKRELFRGPSTQLVFSNMGINGKPDRPFSGYRWMKQEWVRRGIPADQIAFIKDYDTPLKKQRLFNDVNEGKVRILVGSTQKMGTGLNVQRRLAAIHNLDPLWYPADDEQRVGRGVRQGNLNPEIAIHDYSTKGTYDSTMWQMMGRKGRFIEQFFRGDPTMRNMDDLGEAGMYEQAAAMATSDERVIRLTEMRQELQKLQRQDAAHSTEQYGFRRQERNLRDDVIPGYQEDMRIRAQDIARRDANADQMTVGQNSFEKPAEFYKALGEAFGVAQDELRAREARPIGNYGGVPLRAMKFEPVLADEPARTVIQAQYAGGWRSLDSRAPRRAISELANDLGALETRQTASQSRLDEARQRLSAISGQLGKEFPDKERIEPLTAAVRALESELEASKKGGPFDWSKFAVGLEGDGKAAGPDGTLYTVQKGWGRDKSEVRVWSADSATPTNTQFVGSGTIKDIVDQLREDAGSEAGLSEERGPFGALPAGLQDRRDQLADHLARTDENDPHVGARDWTRTIGKETGHEHLVAYDATTGEVTHAYTAGKGNAVTFSPDLVSRLEDPNNSIVIHHNHPSDNGLSAGDLKELAKPGLDTIVAHGHGGDTFAARLSPEASMAFRSGEDASAIKGAYGRAASSVFDSLNRLVENGRLTEDEANRVYGNLIGHALDAGGLIEYSSSRDLAPIPPALARNIVRKAGNVVQDYLNARGIAGRDPEDFDARTYRSTDPVRPAEILGGLPGADEDAAPGRSGGDGRDGKRGAPSGDSGWLAEGPRDYTDDAERETLDEALDQPGKPDTPGWTTRFFRALGVGSNAPGAGDHYFNALNKDFTTPMAKASVDPRSNAKMTAELAKFRDTTALVNGYRDQLSSWQGQPPETWRKVFSAMELLTLEGRDVPADGRAVIVSNTDRPLAELSKPGETIRLTSPEELQMYRDYRGVMDNVWKDLVAETAKQWGWEGTPTSKAIQEAAERAEPRERRALERAAKVVAAIEFQRRDAYLPLMRSGDYYFRVRPLEGAPESPLNPWNGEGFPPTVMYKMIDSLTPIERAIGGIREGIPKQAQAMLDELRQTFPESDFSIDHGHAFRTTDEVKNLDIPAVEKLLMLVSTDARGQIRDQLMRSGMDRETARKSAQRSYDDLVDTVLSQVYEQRVAGFKRQRMGIAGYDSDFARSTGRYLNWLSSHISGMRYRSDIENADAAIESHPDPRTRAFWRDWDRRQEDYGDQLHGPLAKLRQGSFYWLLGMNAATTAKIMLHGPLRGAPILSTGLGAGGRSAAIGSYLNAAQQMGRALRPGKDGFEVNFDKVPGLSANERALVDDSLSKGIIHEQTADELGAIHSQGQEALEPRAKFLRRILNIWGSNVSAADRIVRGTQLVAAYRVAQREGMEAINKVWDKDLNWRNLPKKTPEAFAQFMVDKTVGIWGDVNRLPVLRSQLGGLIGQFKQYELGYMSNMHQMLTRMGPEGKVTAAMMLGGLGMMGGTLALPFAQDAATAIAAAYSAITDVSPDIDAELHKAFDAIIPGYGEEMTHGLRPFGVDWSSIGFGDLLGRNARSPLDFAGAAISTAVGAPYRAWQRFHSGQGNEAATAELLPNSVKRMLGALYPELSQYSITGKTKLPPLSDEDRVKSGLGFQPASRAEQFERIQHATHAHSAFEAALNSAENRFANFYDSGDMDGAQQAQQDALRLIADAERHGVVGAQESAAYQRAIKQKLMQRAAPTAGNRAQQRFETLSPQH